MEETDKSIVKKWRKDGHSYDSINGMLNCIIPNVDKGVLNKNGVVYVRTVCRYCKKHKLENISKDELMMMLFLRQSKRIDIIVTSMT